MDSWSRHHPTDRTVRFSSRVLAEWLCAVFGIGTVHAPVRGGRRHSPYAASAQPGHLPLAIELPPQLWASFPLPIAWRGGVCGETDSGRFG